MRVALLDGVDASQVPLDDRGLAYGDGLFETMRVAGHGIPLWHRHWTRLDTGCRRLRMPLPDRVQLEQEIARACAALGGDGVLKLILTRSPGARGYAPGAGVPRRMVLGYEYAPLPAPVWQEGARLRWCELRLPLDPALAGIKHLNRLHQVLARAEWNDPDVHEGLLCDIRGLLVSATSANLYLRFGRELVTPELDAVGIAGVARAEMLDGDERVWKPVPRAILPDRLREADEVFLSNAIHGVIPVRQVGEQRFAPGAATRSWQRHFERLGFGRGAAA